MDVLHDVYEYLWIYGCSSMMFISKKGKYHGMYLDIIIYVLTHCPFECHFHVENDDGIFGHPAHPVFGNAT